jgi:hypothetical protein
MRGEGRIKVKVEAGRDARVKEKRLVEGGD